MTEEEDSSLTLEEDFAKSMLLLDPIVPSELQDDDERTLLEEAVLRLLLLDTSLSLEDVFDESVLLLDELLMTDEEEEVASFSLEEEEVASFSLEEDLSSSESAVQSLSTQM